ncbi:MAG: response regulator transcription factor [Mycobacterium sp.]
MQGPKPLPTSENGLTRGTGGQVVAGSNPVSPTVSARPCQPDRGKYAPTRSSLCSLSSRPEQTHTWRLPSAATPNSRPPQGATNRDAATQLHLSPHTVKTHLHNAFTKLGITCRAQLAQLMRRR